MLGGVEALPLRAETGAGILALGTEARGLVVPEGSGVPDVAGRGVDADHDGQFAAEAAGAALNGVTDDGAVLAGDVVVASAGLEGLVGDGVERGKDLGQGLDGLVLLSLGDRVLGDDIRTAEKRRADEAGAGQHHDHVGKG